jgi:outer membrane protein with beta-barrel domain
VTRLRCFALVFVLALPAVAAAQQPYKGAGARGGKMELSVAAAWTAGYEAGNSIAQETRNPTTGSSPLTLFNANGDMLSGAGVEGHIGYYLTPRVSVEGTFQYTRPTLRVSLSNDFENADATTADETVSTYLFGGSVLYHFRSGPFVPFVSGGAGYLRQLQEGGSDASSGAEVHGGGGIKYWFGASQKVGLRVDAQISSRSKSVAFEDKRRIIPSLAGGIAFVF